MIMLKNFCYSQIIFLSLCIISCTNSKSDLQDNILGHHVTLIEENDSLLITDSLLSSYNRFSIYENTSGNYIYAYNGYFHKIDIFDLNRKGVSCIQLQKEGADGLGGDVYSLFVQSPDSIWIYCLPYFYLVDAAGRICKKMELPYSEGGFIYLEANFSISTNRLFYHSGRKSLFYLCVTPTADSATYEVYEYNLQTGDYEKYLLEGEELEEKAGQNFGWKQYPNVSYTDSLIVYNFPITSNIYTISLDSGEKNVYGGRSKFTSNLVSELVMPYDFATANKHLLENVHFFEVLYDKRRHLYYRLHLGEVPYSNDVNFYDLYLQKKLYLTVFDASFRVVNETDLGNEVYNYYNFWGVTDKGLFLSKRALLTDDQEHMLRWSYITPSHL